MPFLFSTGSSNHKNTFAKATGKYLAVAQIRNAYIFWDMTD